MGLRSETDRCCAALRELGASQDDPHAVAEIIAVPSLISALSALANAGPDLAELTAVTRALARVNGSAGWLAAEFAAYGSLVPGASGVALAACGEGVQTQETADGLQVSGR